MSLSDCKTTVNIKPILSPNQTEINLKVEKNVNNLSATEVMPNNTNNINNKSIDNPFYHNFKHRLSLSSATSSPTKRTSDESTEEESPLRQPKTAWNPLFKRIKKENNNCLLIDSKEFFIKQELDTELDFNSRQPFVNLFSQLSLQRSGLPAPNPSPHLLSKPTSSSRSEEPLNSNMKDLSEDLMNKLNINLNFGNNCVNNKTTDSALNPNNKSKKKKNKKSKKAKKSKKFDEKRIKNVFKCLGKTKGKANRKSKIKNILNANNNSNGERNANLFKLKSTVIPQLKVSALGGLTASEVQELINLKNEGIVRRHRKINDLYKCLLCNQRFSDRRSAEEHVYSESHLRAKSEQRFSASDSMLAIDIGANTDIEVLLARKQQLSELSNKTKGQLYSRGIRLKDGFGSNAFVCVECNDQPLDSLAQVNQHLEYKSKLNHFSATNLDDLTKLTIDSSFGANISTNFEPRSGYQSINSNAFSDLTDQQKQKLFENEGIVRKIHRNSRKKKLKYFCLFCQKFRITDEEMFKHINDFHHIRTKSGLKIKGIDAIFALSSDRVNEFEVAFARITALRELDQDLKLRLIAEGIRLRDGIGGQAFECHTCELSLPAQSFETGLDVVNNHLKCDSHLSRKSTQPRVVNNLD